jgi:phage tail-like protein
VPDGAELAEFVQTFRFTVWLTRSTSPGPTLSAPPPRTGGAARAPAGARRPAAGPPAAGARGTAPFGGQGGGGGPAPDLLGHGAFADCHGLELEADVKDLLEGGANDATVRRAGRVKNVPIVLKRGMFVVGGDPAGPPGGTADTALWDWLQGMVAGTLPVPRYDGTIEVRDPADRRVVARWVFTRGLPQKVTGPQLDAKTGGIALEELTIVHEGLRMEPVS